MAIKIQDIISGLPKHIRDTFIPVTFEVGDHIIEINTEAKYGYLFTEGAIDVMHINSKDVLYTYCQDYIANFVGLMEIYSGNDIYCCTCRAHKKCVGYRLTKETYLKMLEECDEFKKYLIHYWANQFYSQALNRKQYPNNRTETKIINYLAELVTKNDSGNKTVELKVKREDVAEYIGCSKRTIYRIFNQLEERELISKKGHLIVINSAQRKRILKENENRY